MLVWAWEFLRRNEEYRSCWLALVAANRRETWEKFEEFGIQLLWDPRQSSSIPTFSDLGTALLPSPAARYERLPDSSPPASPLGFVQPSRANLSKEEILENSKFSLSWFEMAVAIDLRLPLDDQLKAIRKLAEEEQALLKKAGLINPKTARTSDKYALYLRILDAEDAGVKRSDIEDALFPNIDNSYPQRLRSKAFDNARLEARRLRDTGYRALAYRIKCL